MSVKQISIFLENKTGRLDEMTKVLADNSINMRAVSLAETDGFGIVRIIVDVPKNLTPKQKDLLKQFNDSLPNKPKNNIDDGKTVGEEKKGFFDKFKL